jgi:hypothetical protein
MVTAEDDLSEIPRTRTDPFADISKAESAAQCSQFNAGDRSGSAELNTHKIRISTPLRRSQDGG